MKRSLQYKLDKLCSGRIHREKHHGIIHLTGHCSEWQQAVEAGLLAAKKGSRTHVVNDIVPDSQVMEHPLGSLPDLRDNSLDGRHPDVLIIGGGVIGCAIARELTKSKLDILLIEKEYDVAVHASSRNDGVIHPGIDLLPGLLKKKYNNRGNPLYDQLARELDIPFERVGQHLVFQKRSMKLPAIASLLYFNLSVAGKVRFIEKNKLHRLEPGLSDRAAFALFFEGAGIICPFNLTIALAENAIQNGAEISLNTAALSMDLTRRGKKYITAVHTNRGTIYPRLVISAAGVFAEEIARMAGDRFFSIHPRKGSSVILDKKVKANIHSVYSFLQGWNANRHSKGGGIIPTIHGNVLVGPDAVEVREKEDFSTHRDNLQAVFEKQKNISNWLNPADTIAYFSGIRAATYEEDFILEKGRQTENILHAAGIQSPGLTAAPAIALKMEKMALTYLSRFGNVPSNPSFNPYRKAPPHLASLPEKERDRLIRQNPDYGQILCRCEEISKGEILDAMRRPLPCFTLDGIKRRVRPTSGRCQGGFCAPLILPLIAEEAKILPENVCKGVPGSRILFGEKGEGREEI